MPFDNDFDWQRALLPEVKQICAAYLIGEAPTEEDMERNTDLIVLKMEPKRIACRLRRYEYLHRYPDEITIRSRRPSGVKTELTKVIEGWGDYLFYGFASSDEPTLAAWLLADLTVFRLWHSQQLWLGNRPGIQKRNGDGSADFQAFNIHELPSEFIIARHTLEQVTAWVF